MGDFEKFLDARRKIAIPPGDMARIKLLAKELALGADKRYWENAFAILNFESWRQLQNRLQTYLTTRKLLQDFPDLKVQLENHGYLDNKGRLTQRAFDLVEEDEPYNIFISYKRSESSAFALLVLARLKEHSLVPFCDMALEAGGNWHADLEEKIKENEYFIILLGLDTLASEITVKEICWAIDSDRTIVPIWHNGFGIGQDFDLGGKVDECASKWENHDLRERAEDLKGFINSINAIRVLEESASDYNRVIVELLNRFGITP